MTHQATTSSALEYPTEQPRLRVLIIEPNLALRSAIETVLAAEDLTVESCATLQQLVIRNDQSLPTVALVAWQAMDGLLAEEHRPDLLELSRRVRLVVMVPRRWQRLLENTDIGVAVAAIIPKPIEADQLIEAIERAASA